jgi:hypothetical protein
LGVGGLRIARGISWRTASVLGLTALALAGCGSSSSTTTTGATGTPTRPASTTGGQSSIPAQTTPATTKPTTTTSPATPPSPAKAKFIAQADQICTAANAEFVSPQAKVDAAVKAEQAKGDAAHRAALASAVRAESAVAAAELARLRGLSPPAADRTLVGQYLSTVGDQVQLINQLAAAVAADNGRDVTTVGNKLAAGKTAVDDIAQAYGFKVCGSGAA